MKAPAVLCLFALMLLTLPVSSAADESAVYTFTINYQIQNTSQYPAINARATIYLFDNITGWANQQVLSESITLNGQPYTSSQITKTSDNRWVEIQIGTMPGGSTKTISVTQTLKVTTVKFSINPDSVGTSFPSDVTQFTQPVAGLYESNNSAISTRALSLTENTVNTYYKAKQILDWVISYMTYQRQSTEHGALYGFNAKVGDCTEYSNLFVALARAAGIPAKGISGNAYLTIYNVTGSGADINTVGHAWPIFYLPNYGWVPVDGVWPLNVGSFGKSDYFHIVGASTGGEGVVDSQGSINWPGPGAISTNWQYYVGQPVASGDVTRDISGTVAPEVLLDITVEPSSQITGDNMAVTVTVKNMGKNSAENLSLALDLDTTYFEAPASQTKSSLTSNEQWVATFSTRLKDNAYGNSHAIKANVNYATSYSGLTGGLLATGERGLSIAARPESPLVSQDFLLYILIGVVIGVAVAVAVAVARR
ncbi:MAG: transglutaminase domain-containing protein [Candidatus Hadarchaeota archaeon]